MEVEQGVEEGNAAVGMDLGDELPRMADLFDEAPGYRCMRLGDWSKCFIPGWMFQRVWFL